MMRSDFLASAERSRRICSCSPAASGSRSSAFITSVLDTMTPPLAGSFPPTPWPDASAIRSISNPYLYVNNNPIRFRDPLGLNFDEQDLDFADPPIEQELLNEHDWLRWKINSDIPEYANPQARAEYRNPIAAAVG